MLIALTVERFMRLNSLMPRPKSTPLKLYGARTAYTVMSSLALYTVLSDLMETVQYRRNFIAQRVKEKRGARVEWNKKLAAEYRESALKIKGRIDELGEQISEGLKQIKARPNQSGWMDQETARLIRRRAALRKMYGDTVYTAHILENYYVDK